MLSLLKWTHGKDKGSYTVGINTDWIRRFNIEYFKDEKYDPNMEFAVEWHDTKKPPLGGWTCYMAKVIYISNVNVKITDDGKEDVINEINVDNTNKVASVVVEKVSHDITTHWMALDLPFKREFAIKNKLLRYSWALPLAVEHQNKKDTLEDAIKSLPDYLEYPNTKVFINEVKEKWSSRIKYVLPFSTYHDIHTSIESHERRLELEFSSEIKTHFVLGKK
ncbi:hypothetical protein HCN44_005958 [Aphidius gifuensis]|uniref:Uncharacterized protein n=1 Tax=Aphidius gifuensis TaxID=684658 RepID=A0A835CVE5_APHGI|nr:hypothetical protein HCN44_005958 [Aphidius gifuensis]